ncbi:MULTISPECIES: 4'-phosphopantetheinyl transferase superfamily protein [unclassified Streptomyces]|uniref:4'-phosphopantetheinyl transferase family protein n=1 Tax=unclassified Streptomyces TaxID=2593676 RepID=UPI002E28FD47|nr:4'-phosphopantetheinyl transferase superfamily protein [Streptomyces sp. NBC_01423]WSX92159.1 4'-phosphopantetheinyl transferase superfamily protein [Streptomyces sp. NBC_00891]WSY06636.1 4'-phosphopantetheinyl transferase superfamily protein [Streptomyces sp. NBC_00890]WSZ08260.1 4'-phosphopantetheinyl transferase superfamily protein [Streptomyces sp. NBC_00869]WSZ24241.1 4'-phosphopantetheinyl transferase superfamily protein [Streptomyces sp. NBC_00870]
MLTKLLPSTVATAEATADPAGVFLFPEEESLISNAVPKRRLEFATVRWCARRAMGALGVAPAAVLPGRRGVPQWAPSVVGSMTHCAGFRGVALARKEDFLSVGIDAEPNAPLRPGVLESIALPQELRRTRELAWAVPEVAWDRLLFSIKEAVYKTWFPLTGQELDFTDALVSVDAVQETFTARLLPDPAGLSPAGPTSFSGRWSARDGVLLSAIAVPARRPAGAENGDAPRMCAAGSIR